jgi:hypothetical protein
MVFVYTRRVANNQQRHSFQREQMPTIKIKKGKQIDYPGICPYCGEPDGLVKFPVGSFWNDLSERKLSVPIHKKCWRQRGTSLAIYTAIIIVITFLIWFYFFPDSNRVVLIGVSLAVYFVLHALVPTPIEVDNSEDYIQFNLTDDNYYDEFEKLNQSNVWHKTDQ